LVAECGLVAECVKHFKNNAVLPKALTASATNNRYRYPIIDTATKTAENGDPFRLTFQICSFPDPKGSS
ncbi:MAG: hypothetical protein SFV81_11060, partial [Pirellulaceae bacterium]|nr:hypothetical protein [Pirellulaceae bacterium]